MDPPVPPPPENLAKLFTTLYSFFGFVAATGIVLLCVISLIDISSFTIAETAQNIALTINPNMFNKDGIDLATLQYSKNKPENEPYSIFLQQQIVIYMYWVCGAFVACIVLDVLVAIIIGAAYYISKLSSKSDSKSDSVQFKMDVGITYSEYIRAPMLAIILMFICATTYSLRYSVAFVNNIQPELVEAVQNIKNVTKHIYDNLSTNELFLKSVVDDNINECYRIINEQGNRAETIGSMIFTLSLFNYYKTNTDRSMEKIKEIFTTTQIRLRTVVPIEYMYYNQNAFIPNLYPSIEPFIERVLDTEAKRNAVRKNIASRINNVNKLLIGLFKLNSTRSSIRWYLTVCGVIGISFVICVGFIYKKEFSYIIGILKKYFSKKNSNTI